MSAQAFRASWGESSYQGGIRGKVGVVGAWASEAGGLGALGFGGHLKYEIQVQEVSGHFQVRGL